MEEIKPNNAASLRAIHQVITRGLQVAIENIARFQEEGFPNAVTRRGYLDYVSALGSVLHAHHLTEDDLTFPYFRDKLPDLPVEVLSAQHQQMVPLLSGLQAAVALCAQIDQTQEGLKALSDTLARLDSLWHPHIAIEEEHFDVQRVGEMLPAEEHQRLNQAYGRHTQEHSGPPFLTVPFILFNLPAEIRGVIAEGMPPEVTGYLVPVAWKEQWAAMRPFLLA